MVRGDDNMPEAQVRSVRRKQQLSFDDKVFYFVISAITFIITISVLYPLLYVVSSSFSSPGAVMSGRVTVFPVEFSLDGYAAVFKNQNIITGYFNTFIYTFFGTLLNVVMTLMIAYPLSRRNVPLSGVVMFLFTFTMMFSGGMIPSYIVLQSYGLLNSRLAMIIPGAIGVQNMIITRTFMRNVPLELLEAAKIDGSNDYQYFFTILLPLSKAVIAVITLYYAVGHWNDYFNAFLYLNSREKFPLQIILREILIANSIVNVNMDDETAAASKSIYELLKYALIVVSSGPVLLMYPFVQKYFVKGVMIGSLKG